MYVFYIYIYTYIYIYSSETGIEDRIQDIKGAKKSAGLKTASDQECLQMGRQDQDIKGVSLPRVPLDGAARSRYQASFSN